MNLGNRLLQLRKSHKLTQKAVAEGADITLRAYQNYERGDREPQLDAVLALAQFYSMRVEALVYGSKNSIKPFIVNVNRADMKKTLSQNLKQLRKERGVRQTDLSRETGIPLHSYQNYEYGEQEPTLSRLVTLADFFDVTLDDLAGRVPPGDERKEG